MNKNLDNWNILKKQIDVKSQSPTFKQREIWWCHLGLNIGDEENGKNNNYHRPILIIKKFNNCIFLGAPLTTKIKNNNIYYYQINFKNKKQSIMISQIRILDCKRLDRKLGKIPPKIV